MKDSEFLDILFEVEATVKKVEEAKEEKGIIYWSCGAHNVLDSIYGRLKEKGINVR